MKRTAYVHYRDSQADGRAPDEATIDCMMAALDEHIKRRGGKPIGELQVAWGYETGFDALIFSMQRDYDDGQMAP